MIGENIKNLREQNNYSQIALSKRLGISRSAVNAWEMGISIPSTQYVIELAKIFKVSADYILDIEKSETVNIGYLKKEEKEIIHILLNYFRKYRFAVEFMHELGYVHPQEDYEELLDADYELPKGLKRTLERLREEREKEEKENPQK
ncbi:helix-turn-helix domain-containing protein [Emergencia sp.]|uniref:helix-turn-helix domain-containing protein n=1 Tax=Emergencia sp. TaxID=1926557 RepID=UPI003AEFFC79